MNRDSSIDKLLRKRLALPCFHYLTEMAEAAAMIKCPAKAAEKMTVRLYLFHITAGFLTPLSVLIEVCSDNQRVSLRVTTKRYLAVAHAGREQIR